MAVLDPLRVTVTESPKDLVDGSSVTVPDFPGDETKGTHKVTYSSTLFIERSDFREVNIGLLVV